MLRWICTWTWILHFYSVLHFQEKKNIIITCCISSSKYPQEIKKARRFSCFSHTSKFSYHAFQFISKTSNWHKVKIPETESWNCSQLLAVFCEDSCWVVVTSHNTKHNYLFFTVVLYVTIGLYFSTLIKYEPWVQGVNRAGRCLLYIAALFSVRSPWSRKTGEGRQTPRIQTH